MVVTTAIWTSELHLQPRDRVLCLQADCGTVAAADVLADIGMFAQRAASMTCDGKDRQQIGNAGRRTAHA